MCNSACLEFVEKNARRGDIEGRSVLEVGSLCVNGSVRPILEALGPTSYLGVDIESGPGVDEVCDAGDLIRRFGPETFDVVISTEMLEHIRDWRRSVSNLKQVLKPGGVLLITTRAKGFPYHGYPYDFWRYEISDMRDIFGDMEIEILQEDSYEPGVFLKTGKPAQFAERSMIGHKLYSMLKRGRVVDINNMDVVLFNSGRFARRALGFIARRLLGRARWKKADL